MMRPCPIFSPRPFVVSAAIAVLAVVLIAAVDATEPDPEVQLATATVPLAADGAFQVTIEVYDVTEGQPKQLQDRHLVLFSDGKSYDFALTEPHDGVTVVDPVAGNVTLLSRINHVKSTIPNQDLLTAAAKFRLYAINEGLDDRLGVNAMPQKNADQPNRYQVSFAGYHYEATAAAATIGTQASRFAEFTDWVARVNLIRKLGTPPFARINLGRTIATDGLVPETITLELKSGKHMRTFQSLYTFKNGLSPEGQKRVDEVAGMLTLYREVSLATFP